MTMLLQAVLALVAAASISAAVFVASAHARFADLDRISARNKLTVAMSARDLPPLHFKASDGRLIGYEVALAQRIADALDVRLEISRTAATSAEVIDSVSKAEADLGISYLTPTAETAQYVYFSDPYIVESTTLLINRTENSDYRRYCPGPAELRALSKSKSRAGVLTDSASQELLARHFPDARPQKFATFSNMITAVQDGDIAASIQGELLAKYYLQRRPSAAILLKLCEVGQFRHTVSVAVRPDAPDVLRWLNVFLRTERENSDIEKVILEQFDEEFGEGNHGK